MSRRNSGSLYTALAAFLLICSGASAARAETVAAEWQAHQLKFRYSGFTTSYTCSGIRSAVRRLMLAVGAHKDLKIQVSCAGPMNDIQPFHRMLIAFSAPVAAPEGGVPGETFAAEWRQVKLNRGHPSRLDWGECELVEQFRDQVLIPVFNPRDLVDHTRCTPKKINLGTPSLSMTLLMPVAEATAQATDEAQEPAPEPE